MKVWKEVNERGIIDLAIRLKESGRSRAVGIITHDAKVVKLAIETEVIDVTTQPGVCTTIVGVGNFNELREILAYHQSSQGRTTWVH